MHRNVISIHVPREGDDPIVLSGSTGASYFNPRPPRGGRLPQVTSPATTGWISIHVPREGDDWNAA